MIKWPLASLLLLVAGVAGCLRLPPDPRRRLALAVGLPAILICAFTLAMPKDVGVRYLLPAIALGAAAAASGIVTVLGTLSRAGRRRLAEIVVAVLLGAALLVTAGSFPRSIAWTTWPFRPGYAAATDSDLDWGQDLYALRAWSRGRDPWVAYFGPRGITTADVPGARPLLGASPARVDGWVAATATTLNSANRSSLSWLRAWCPVAVLDETILVYHFSRPPTAAGIRPPAQPAPLCPGEWSSAAR